MLVFVSLLVLVFCKRFSCWLYYLDVFVFGCYYVVLFLVVLELSVVI